MMKNNFIENWCVGTGSGGTVLAGVSMANVVDIMTIVFLAVQIFVLLLGITIKFFKFIKDGKIDEEEARELLDDVDKIKDTIDKESKKNDRN